MVTTPPPTPAARVDDDVSDAAVAVLDEPDAGLLATGMLEVMGLADEVPVLREVPVLAVAELTVVVLLPAIAELRVELGITVTKTVAAGAVTVTVTPQPALLRVVLVSSPVPGFCAMAVGFVEVAGGSVLIWVVVVLVV